MEINEKIRNWFTHNYPNVQVNEISELSGGQSNLLYLVNQKYVLKIYLPKYDWASENQSKHFLVGSKYMPLLENTGFTPKIYGVYPNDSILQADAILMEKLIGKDLSKILYTYSDQEKFEMGRQVGNLLRLIHSSSVQTDQEYNTIELWQEVYEEYEDAKKKGLLYSEVASKAKEILKNYKPRTIKSDLVLIHGDAHPENFILTSNGLKLIDLDMCQLKPAFIELRMILHATCMPANVVAEELEQYYPEGSLVEWFKGILLEYPEISPKQYLDEINLIALYEILVKLNLPDSVHDKDTPRKRAMGMLRLVFETDLMT